MTQYDQFIQYGRVEHGEQFQKLPLRLKEMAYVYSFLARVLFSEQSTTTSIYRPKTTDSGIHAAYRAIDFKPLQKDENTYRMIEIMNHIYGYDPDSKDPKRLALKVADENPYHGTGFHTHLQVHENTKVISQAKLASILALAAEQKKAFQPKPLGVT